MEGKLFKYVSVKVLILLKKNYSYSFKKSSLLSEEKGYNEVKFGCSAL